MAGTLPIDRARPRVRGPTLRGRHAGPHRGPGAAERDPADDPDGERRHDLVRLVATTDASVEIVEGHEDIAALGGAGALLRYWAPDRRSVLVHR